MSAAAPTDLGPVARGGALNLVGSMVYGAANLALVAVVTAQLGAEGTGEFLLAIAAFNIVARLCELGLSTGLVRTISRDLATGAANRLPTAVVSGLVPVLAVGLVAAVAVWWAAPSIGEAVADGSSAQAVGSHLRTLAPFIPVAAVYTVALQGTRGFATMRPQVLIERLAKPLVQVAAVAASLALVDPHGGTALDLAWGGPVALASVPAGVWFRRLLRRAVRASPSPGVVDRRAVATDLWRFSGPRALSQLFAVAVLWFDTLLIGALRSAEEAGIYAASTRYLLIGTFTMDAVMQVLGPHVSRHLARGEHGAVERLYRVATTWQLGLIAPVYLGVLAFAPALLDLFGEEFRAGSTALMILSAGVVVAAALGPADTLVLMSGRSVLNLANAAATLALNVGGNLLLTPRLGIEGAAIAWSAAIVANAALPAIQLHRATGIQPLTWRPLVALVAAIGAVGAPSGAIRLLLGPGPGALALAVVVSAVALAVTAVALRGPLELGELRGAFRRPPAAAAPLRQGTT